MGLFDTILLLDRVDACACPHGHGVRALQTKDLDPSMSTYLVQHGQLVRASPREERSGYDEDAGEWRIEGTEAIHERRYTLEPVLGTKAVRVWPSRGSCGAGDTRLE
jgi:hypothetical protein